MQADGKRRLIKLRYDTDDIIDCVLAAYARYHRQCSELAGTLRRENERETCRAVNDYVVRHVAYREDSSGYQHVKTPARLLADGVGDCKSMAVFCASCLTCLGIPCSFRFVGFEGDTDYRHVYVVTDGGVNVDPVECICNGRPFGEVGTFTIKKDMKAKGLSILSGVGSADPYKAFLNDTDLLTNTRAANYLYSCLDLQFTFLAASPDSVQHINDCVRLLTALALYEEAAGNEALLDRSASILQSMADEGWFSSASTDDRVREDELERAVNRALDLLASDTVQESAGSVREWFAANVKERDYNSLSAEDRLTYESAFGNAVGSSGANNALADRVKQAEPGFLYSLASDKVLAEVSKKYGVIARKAQSEKYVRHAWNNTLDIYLDKDTVDNLILSGCMAASGKSPDDTLRRLAGGGKVEGIGGLWNWIVNAAKWLWNLAKWLWNLAKSVLNLILGKAEAEVEAQKVENTVKQIKNGEVAPAPTDVPELKTEGGRSSAGAGWLMALVAGGMLLAMAKGRK